MKRLLLSALALLALTTASLAQCPGVNCNTPTVMMKPLDGIVPTYSVASGGYTVAASPTDVFQICGSATRTIKVTQLSIVGRATTAQITPVKLIRRSTASTSGTNTTETVASYDSTQSTATAAVLAWTANGTPGTFLAAVRTAQVFFGGLTTAISDPPLTFNFGDRPSRAVTLRGVAQCLVVNLESTTNSGNVININVEWTEE